MSRSKQLGAFQTSGAFGFRQAHTHRSLVRLTLVTKDLIRRSSENIAAREVEAVIRVIPEIADVAAVPVRDAKRGEVVKLYVELEEGLGPDDLPVERILEHARANLAAFKVQRYIAFTPVLPRPPQAIKYSGVSDGRDRSA